MNTEPIDHRRDSSVVDASTSSFVLHLMLASSEQNRYTLNQLVESFRNDNRRLKATLQCIQDRIQYLLSQPYSPAPHVLLAALRPSEEELRPYIGDIVAWEERH